MGILNLFKSKETSWEDENAWDGSGSMTCPRCGQDMIKRYNFSAWYCENCHAGLDEDMEDFEDMEDYEGDTLSVYDAALIWASNGKDEDYMFGYTEEELEDAL